jgi:hypothetical protein
MTWQATKSYVKRSNEVSAKTVGGLGNMTSWPENAVITIPQQRDPESAVKVGKASVVTHYPPRR